MKRAKLTQRAFAKKAGVSQPLVQHWLNGSKAPVAEDADTIAVSLGLKGSDYDHLLDMLVAGRLDGPLLKRYLALLDRLKASESEVSGLARTVELQNTRIIALESQRKA